MTIGFYKHFHIFLSITNIKNLKSGFDSLRNITQHEIRVRFPNLLINAGSIPAFIKQKNKLLQKKKKNSEEQWLLFKNLLKPLNTVISFQIFFRNIVHFNVQCYTGSKIYKKKQSSKANTIGYIFFLIFFKFFQGWIQLMPKTGRSPNRGK